MRSFLFLITFLNPGEHTNVHGHEVFTKNMEWKKGKKHNKLDINMLHIKNIAECSQNSERNVVPSIENPSRMLYVMEYRHIRAPRRWSVPETGIGKR